MGPPFEAVVQAQDELQQVYTDTRYGVFHLGNQEVEMIHPSSEILERLVCVGMS